MRCGKLGVWVFNRFIVLADLLNSIRSSTVFTSLGSFCSEYLKISAAAIASLRALWWALFMRKISFSVPRPYFGEAIVRRARSIVQSLRDIGRVHECFKFADYFAIL